MPHVGVAWRTPLTWCWCEVCCGGWEDGVTHVGESVGVCWEECAREKMNLARHCLKE